MVVFAVSFEMVLELEYTLAQDCNLHLRRTGIGLVNFVFGNYFRFQNSRQCHARVKTPRLTLIDFKLCTRLA